MRDKYGRIWDIPATELCPKCHQPDACGDCNHKKLRIYQVLWLNGLLSVEERKHQGWCVWRYCVHDKRCTNYANWWEPCPQWGNAKVNHKCKYYMGSKTYTKMQKEKIQWRMSTKSCSTKPGKCRKTKRSSSSRS